MKRITLVLVAVSLLACPLASSPASAAEGPRPKKTSYTVVSRTGGLVRVAALEWAPKRAKTVLLALHAVAGAKENYWGPLVVPGYSFALHRYAEGRATVAIDLPGYGESKGDPNLIGMDDYAFVVKQIADDLRTRFRSVVGVGQSMGALVVNLAQGMFGSFDAIVPTSYSHGGGSAQYKATCGQRACPNARKLLFTSYADPRVVKDFIGNHVPPASLTLMPGAAIFTGPPQLPDGPAGDDVTATITVPVLLILGKDDFVFDHSKYAEEPSHYPSSPDVKLVVLPHTGHAVFHHLNHRYVDAIVGNWLSKHNF